MTGAFGIKSEELFNAYAALDYFAVKKRAWSRIAKFSERMDITEAFKILRKVKQYKQDKVCAYVSQFFVSETDDKTSAGLFNLFLALCDYKSITLNEAETLWSYNYTWDNDIELLGAY